MEFDTRRVFTSLRVAQQALDEWVLYYNTERPHQALDMATPAQKFHTRAELAQERPADTTALGPERGGGAWVSRRVAVNGVISVSWRQICLGVSHAGANVDVHVEEQLLQVWHGDELIKTVTRTSHGEVRKKMPRCRSHGPNL